MSAPKVIIIGSSLLFLSIGTLALLKKKPESQEPHNQEFVAVQEPLFIPEPIVAKETVVISAPPAPAPVVQPPASRKTKLLIKEDDTEHVDEIYRFFTLSSSKYPFIETITYTSRVSWLKGRPAWIADYASHFKTSKHFIARSLNGKPDYFTQKVSPGDRFNVFKPDHDVSFHLVIDLSRCKMWFYAIDLQDNARYLVKTYKVGLGRLENISPSGSLTPIGKFLLGAKVALYKPGVKGIFQDEEAELIQVFGTRWIPFGEEIGETSHPAKGYGIHGSPWVFDEQTQELVEDRSTVQKYASDGCIRLNREDMEELFAIIITKPTVVEIVSDYTQSEVPGIEKRMED